MFAAHRLGLVRLAVLLVDDQATAEDVVQDAFAGLLRRIGDGAVVDQGLSYLRTAVVNNARSVLRRRRTARWFAPLHEPAGPGPEDVLILADEHVEILRLVQRLPRRQREVLVLRYWSGLSEAEIAGTLGISPGAVKSTASRGVAALKRHLEAH